MSFRKVSQQKISDVIAGEIERQLVDGTIKPGDRLPSERDLAKEFEVSRPSIREAIQTLKSRNLLVTRPGGGTYAENAIGDTLTDPLVTLLSNDPSVAQDLLEFRYTLEGLSAYYAAERATDADKQIIKLRYDSMMKAHENLSAAEEAAADVDFHLSIAEASHNVVLLHVMRSLFTLLHKSVELSFEKLYIDRSGRKTIPEQHELILNAILSGDAEGAREEAYKHINYIQAALNRFNREELRNRTSQQRLERITRNSG